MAEDEIRGTDWTTEECDLVVRDYFSMLQAELLSETYNKSEHRQLLKRSVRRSNGSIEFKHQNISAILNNQRQPYISGYKPRGNVQGLLVDTVEDYLEEHPSFFTEPRVMAAIEPTELPPIPISSSDQFFEAPPDPGPLSLPSQTKRSRRGRKIDFALKDSMNRQLGKLGEQFVVELEQKRLGEAGRDDLASKVELVAETRGDGLGFDVLSFHAVTADEHWLEVKTTTLGKFHPFLVTANEVELSEESPERFLLFRVFDFRSTPRVFILPGSLNERCRLVPQLYRAGPPFAIT